MNNVHSLCLNPDDFNNPEIRKHLEGKLVVPVDLAALGFCEKQRLPFELCEAFSDLELYETVFKKVQKVLNESMYDKTFFPSRLQGHSAKVNPLFISFYQLIALFGNTLLKILEIQHTLNRIPEKELIFLEFAVSNRRWLSCLNYTDVIGSYFADRIKPWKGEGIVPGEVSYGKDDPGFLFSLHEDLLNSFFAFQGLFLTKKSDCPNGLFIMTNAPFRKVFSDKFKFQNKFSSLRYFVTPIEKGFKLRKENCYLEEVIPELSKRVYAEFKDVVDRNLFFKCVRFVYEKYQSDMEGPYQEAFGSGLEMKEAAKKNFPGYLIARNSIKPRQRAFLYRKYLENYKIISLEYGDGVGTGALEEPVNVYRSAPIADALIFDAQFSGDFTNRYFGEDQHHLDPVIKSFPVFLKKKQLKNENVLRRGKKKIFYVPTRFSGYCRTGPGNELHDITYWLLQKKILEALVSLSDYEVVFKAHPKFSLQGIHDFQLKYFETLGVSVETKYLEEVVGEADVLVSDFFNSGLFKAMWLGVPIVYLDIKVKRLFEEFKKSLPDRVCWIDCDINTDEWQEELKKAVRQMSQFPKPESAQIIENPDHVINFYNEILENKENSRSNVSVNDACYC